MRAPQRRVHRPVVANIGFHKLDLTHPPHGKQEMGGVGFSYRSANAPAIIGERTHNVPPEETGAAEYGDELVGGDRRHSVRTKSDLRALCLAQRPAIG